MRWFATLVAAVALLCFPATAAADDNAFIADLSGGPDGKGVTSRAGNADAINAGHVVCNKIAGGLNISQLRFLVARNAGLTPSSAEFFVRTSINHFCPGSGVEGELNLAIDEFAPEFLNLSQPYISDWCEISVISECPEGRPRIPQGPPAPPPSPGETQYPHPSERITGTWDVYITREPRKATHEDRCGHNWPHHLLWTGVMPPECQDLYDLWGGGYYWYR